MRRLALALILVELTVAACAHAAPAQDTKAPPRKFVQDWKVDDLKPLLERASPRDIESGRAVYAAAECNKCHQLEEKGIPIGPDLTRLREKFRGLELLRQILDPSAIIEPAYKPYVIMMKDFSTVTGFIEKESKKTIVLKPNVIYSETPLEIPRSDISAVMEAPNSAMPEDLLNTFTAEEILDLVAYLEADEKSRATLDQKSSKDSTE